MKRANNLFEKIIDYDNLLLAHKNAKKGKLHYKDVQKIEENPQYYIEKLQECLKNKTFTTSEYQISERKCGDKLRTIHVLPYYPDRIVQHAIIQIIGPILLKSFIRDTFQSIKNRGTSDAFKRVKKAIQMHDPKYCLKIDIEKYYPNIDNHILKQKLRKKIKCKNTLWILDDIIDSTKGLPIGNYTSQCLGNFYLSDFDWWIKQKKCIKMYYRYCDDFIILHNDKLFLHALKQEIDSYLTQEKLIIKSNWQVFDIESQGLNFVGFIFKYDYIKLRPKIVKNLKTKRTKILNHYSHMSSTQIINSLYSYWGWIKYINAKNLWKTILTYHMISILKLKFLEQSHK